MTNREINSSITDSKLEELQRQSKSRHGFKTKSPLKYKVDRDINLPKNKVELPINPHSRDIHYLRRLVLSHFNFYEG